MRSWKPRSQRVLDDLIRVALEIWPTDLRPVRTCSWAREDFRDYQVQLTDMVKLCVRPGPKKKPGIILALEPGAGKTAIVLTAARDLLDEGTIRKALVTAPLLVAKTVWSEEIGEWEHLKDTTWTLIRAEDDDPEIVAAGEAAYAKAFAFHSTLFEAEVMNEARRNPSQASARNIVRDRWARDAFDMLSAEDQAQLRRPRYKGDDPLLMQAALAAGAQKMPKATPSDLANLHRMEAVATAKETLLRRLAAEPTEIHIINKEALLWLWNHFGEGSRWPYDIIIGDDLREFRSGKARSAGGVAVTAKGKKAAAPLSRWGVLAAARKHVKAMIELTGTPTPKGLHNLWGVAYLVDLGERLGLNLEAFMRRYFDVNQYDRSIEPREHAFASIIGKLKDIMFSLDPKAIGELPPFLPVPIRVELPADVLQAYKTFRKELVSEEYDVEAVNGGVLHGKLLQFANGSMYQEDGNDIHIHDLKIEALKNLVEALDGTPLLVAYTFQFDIERIMKALPKAVLLTPSNALDFTRRWNKDEIAVGLVHRASAGHGLNMQKGTGHMCEYGLTTDAELFLQFKKRILRSGRKTSVINHIIIAKGTIDEDVYPMYLNPRIENQEQILEALRLTQR
jgi:hypothetical protein